jgi:hypothetical protein
MWIVIGIVLVVLLAIAFVMDQRSRKIRGRAGAVNVPSHPWSVRNEVRTQVRVNRVLGRNSGRYQENPSTPTDKAP